MTDVFITLLTLGQSGYDRLLKQRKEAFAYLHAKLTEVAAAHGERVLDTRGNPISLAMTLTTVARDLEQAGKDVTFFGSMLFTRCVSGTRWARRGGVGRLSAAHLIQRSLFRSLTKTALHPRVVSGTASKDVSGFRFQV